MDDLIEKFFKKDLTEAEEKALEDQIASSDEAAEGLAKKADEAYQSFGLPEPRWTGPDSLRPKPGFGFLGWFFLVGFVAALGVGLGWFYLHTGPNSSVTSIASKQQPTTVGHSLTPVKKPASVQSQPLSIVAVLPVQTAKDMPSQRGSSLPTQAQRPVSMALPASQFTPIDVDRNPNQAFSKLSVQLHLSASRTLVVRVLDGQGKELVLLFSGQLPAGTWAFEWNGLLKDGSLAPAGKYTIEVRAGSWVQVKELLIQK